MTPTERRALELEAGALVAAAAAELGHHLHPWNHRAGRGITTACVACGAGAEAGVELETGEFWGAGVATLRECRAGRGRNDV